MKLKSLLSISLFLNVVAFSQPDNADSLNAVLDTISDPKEMVYFCMKQGDVYMNTDLESFEYWYQKGMNIASISGQDELLVMLYAYLSYEYDSRGDYEKQAECIHTGQQYLTDETPFKYRRAIMAAEAEYYLRVEQLQSAIDINLEIIRMSKEENDSVSLSATLHNIGISYYHLGEIEKADSLIKEAYIINGIIGQEGYKINNLTMLANIQSRLGNHAQSLEYNKESLAQYKAWNDVSGITLVYSNMAENYWDLGQKKTAFIYLDSALEFSQKYDLKEWEWITLSRYAAYYESDKNYKQALEYYKLFSETKSNSINQQSSTKLESLTSELNEKELEILKQNEELQNEKIKLQEEQITSQELESEKKNILLFVIIGGLLAAIAFGIFIYKRLKITNEQNKIIEEQRAEVQNAYEKIAEKNLDITASINYAKRIQNAILPNDHKLTAAVKDYFILFKPKDLVSGDFYWTEIVGDHTFIAVADCTGHGVPGAIVSVICHNALNRSVKEFNLTDPGQILDKTRDIVIEQFDQSNENVKDGMDIALCAINKKTSELKFAGANNPLWILRNEEIIPIKGDKQPIGSHALKSPFATHSVVPEKNDKFYIFSDGYADQFGGDKGKKFKSKSLITLLTSIKETPLNSQGKKLDEAFENWKADFEQLDDVCVMGFEI